MLVRPLAITAMLLAMALAGCLSATDDAGTGDETLNENNNTGPGAPPQGRGNLLAFEETNATEEGKGGLEHHHDYWAGRTRVDWVFPRAMMEPWPDVGSYAEFYMPQGALVYEGTVAVEFLVSNPARHVCEFYVTFGGKYTCTDDNGLGLPKGPTLPDPAPPKLTLEYKHAAADEWIPMGALTWGEPLVIPLNSPIETDMPHSEASLWLFKVISDEPLANTVTFDAMATIVRGEGEIPLWPGHPDFYAKSHFREIYSGVVTVKESGQYPDTVATHDAKPFKPEKLISWGTQTLYVYANITDYKGDPAFAPTTWYLYFHNATGAWNITNAFDKTNNSVGEATSLKFVLRVDPAGMDTPYAPASRWEFLLRGTYMTPDAPRQFSCYSGCASYEVTYQLTIIASDIKESEYTCAGLGTRYC